MSPPLYNNRLYVPEHYRIAYTRFRLGSHRFKIETGRWSRIPRERRLCLCGEVQDELHILQHCELLHDIRQEYTEIDFTNVVTIMEHENVTLLSKYVYVITKRINEINEN